MLTRFITEFSRMRARRATEKQLYSLTDRELRDIGLSRDDIAGVIATM